jgi:hypothetical protein
VTLTATTNGEAETPSFYEAAPLEPLLLYQGEILIDVPLLLMPKPTRWLLLRTRENLHLDTLNKGINPSSVKVLDSNQTAVAWADGSYDSDYAMARLSRNPVIVVSQTCDISNKDYIAVAPVHPAHLSPPETIEKAKQGEIFDAFYLPAHVLPHLGESFADFSQIQSVHKSYIKRIAPEQHFRLTEANILLLQQRITRYFGRPNSFDARVDRAPGDGVYQCIACFYVDGVVSSCTVQKGDDLPHCETCGGFQWIKKATRISRNSPNA